mmetsp:Transcript_23177/g.52948  ORF Transcript_23177/g.52948 Transcript_23177/m.52948 type:complete len:256 (-) Transcript_23177:164-931(-)|eukprot:CAMPEP_0113314796 /NCGR_PEP_ID=MMETSP0010_2-20120614/10712_1 /TAXON_ID=216773 ORGANISM="Corethron hystrix, Strain 308" /NCGR_SAMPLE_ID=MMETSP0010_2 /ASSEMBLY_ACC=CAM_ASM_000155 /LENGTH=255 /DNA_ID=CAMNT_0000171151 /DNA_START=87 /DNA_END=854 /DNA_ORIENTATION=- /assembly_acc=CAM_ASM_000155
MATQHQQASVLILGGWSPGPLPYLQRCFEHSCIFLEPAIPMPPVGFLWCRNRGVLALIATIFFTIQIFIAIYRTNFVYGARPLCSVFVVALSVPLLRGCVAWIVRDAVAEGVRLATPLCENRSGGAAVVVGFSWGGHVGAEMLRQGLVGKEGRPGLLLIAPTTALVARIALVEDPAIGARVKRSNRVHVFHGTKDGAFCPHAERWEGSGASLHWCEDDHVFSRTASMEVLRDTLARLIQTSTQLHDGILPRVEDC